MTATTLPAVSVQWHGKNDYATHDVATKSVVADFVNSVPMGREFTAEEATNHLISLVEQDVKLIERVYGTKDAAAHDPALSNEMSDQSDLHAVGYALDENKLLEVISEYDFGYAADPQTQYRRI